MRFHIYGLLFRLSVRLLKYYLLFLFGFTVVCLVSLILGATSVASVLANTFGTWFLRGALFLICLVAIAAVLESLND